jgi:hypothetical protein
VPVCVCSVRISSGDSGHEMALELSKQAFELCREQDAPGLRAFLEAHPGVDLTASRGGRDNKIILQQHRSGG